MTIIFDGSLQQPARASHSFLEFAYWAGNKPRGEALYDLPQRWRVSIASPLVIHHLGCGDKCFRGRSIHGTKEALAYISLSSLSPSFLSPLPDLERSVVPWKHDKEEKRCMKCHKSFGVRRRRHHCRLCGDIICKQCSSFITLNEACEGLEIFL